MGRYCLNLLVLGLILASEATLFRLHGQDGEEGHEPLVVLKSVKVAPGKSDKEWTLKVSGSASKVPKGTKIELWLTWRGKTVDSFDLTLDGNSFTEEFSTKNAPISSDLYYFRSVIFTDKQKGAVKKAIQDNTKTFPPALDPFTDYHLNCEFHIGTDAQIEEQMGAIKGFFVERGTKVKALDGRVKAAREKIEAGEDEEFTEKDGFSAKKWRKFMDKEVIDVLIQIQKDIEDAFQENQFIPFRLHLSMLKDITNGIARRVLDNSAELYKSQGLTPVEEDTKPEKVDLTTRSRRIPGDKALERGFKELGEALVPTKNTSPEQGGGSP